MTSTIICSLLNTCQVKEWYIPMISVQPIKIHSSRFKQIRPTERVLSSFSPSKKIFISSPTLPAINTNKPADHKNYLSLDHLMTTFLPELKDDAVLCSTDSVVAFNNFSLRNDFLEFKKKTWGLDSSRNWQGLHQKPWQNSAFLSDYKHRFKVMLHTMCNDILSALFIEPAS